MKTPSLSLCAIFAGCVAIAACSQATELSRLHYTPNVDIVPGRGVSPLSYSVLYSFGNHLPDGSGPLASLIDVGGTLYGTTQYGGGNGCYNIGCGTVYAVTTGGTEKVLHGFGGPPDGESPFAGLVNVRGTLYGTTELGGAYRKGTIFSITTSGREKVLHSFGLAPDGSSPFAGLVNLGGTLYGTTAFGGAYGKGTVFSITTSGAERVLHSFGIAPDGKYPYAGLIDVGDTLYGTTDGGGVYGGGTVFSTTPGGAEKVLYSFGSRRHDGGGPSGLINVRGTFYGATVGGGAYGYGTVFSVTTGGIEHVVYSFGGAPDGEYPGAGLVNVGGTLYGTTQYGGTGSCLSPSGCGTVFAVTRGGKEKVLHSFDVASGPDGEVPRSALVNVHGTLYGTTEFGGGGGGGGTVFSITTSGTENVLR